MPTQADINADRPQHNDNAETVLGRVKIAKLYDLTDVIAVVTGGNSGIGMHIASTLLANGAKVVYIVGLEQPQLDAVASTYTTAAKHMGLPGKMIGIQGNIGTKAEAVRLAKLIGDEAGYVTALFNNAGASAGRFTGGSLSNQKTAGDKQKVLLDIDESGWTFLNDIHMVGPFYMSVAFLHLLEKSNQIPTLAGRISSSIAITASCSADGHNVALAGYSYAYMLSKRAAMHLVSALARDFLPLNIRVNGINPGWFVTNMGRPLSAVDALGRTTHRGSFDNPSPHIPEAIPPSGRGGRPQDMGQVGLFLVCDDYITGRTITLDGGLML